MYRGPSQEITLLKDANASLMQRLKRLGELVATQVRKFSLNERKEPTPHEIEARLMSEIDSLDKLRIVYEKEIAILKDKLSVKADSTRVLALEKDLAELRSLADDFTKQKRALEQAINTASKVHTKIRADIEDYVPQQEVRSGSSTRKRVC